MSVSAIVPEKSRVNKVWRTGRSRTTKFLPFWHCSKISVTWLFATFLIPVCSFCRGQHVESMLDQFRFSFVFFWGCQKSTLIAILYLRLLLVAFLLILGYDATASSNSSPRHQHLLSTSQALDLRLRPRFTERPGLTPKHWLKLRPCPHALAWFWIQQFSSWTTSRSTTYN